MKKIFLLLILCLGMSGLNAQQVIKLWEGKPPTDNGISRAEDLNETGRPINITDPNITVYVPEKSKNKKIGILICPGGGYQHLAMQHEGYQFAEWLVSEGYTAFVLKYRMPNGHKEVPLEDATQAMTHIRKMSKKWDIEKVGIAGFSAGGHLAATASVHFVSDNTRPDFSLLFYPVISMGEYAHKGSKNNLLGEAPSQNDLESYSLEKQIKENTPPTILLLSNDDRTVSSINSTMYYQALKEKNVPATLYIFPTGGHGWGMRENFIYHNEMLSLLKRWLEETIK